MKQLSIELNGLTLRYTDNGAIGPAIVFVHGNSHSKKTFRKQLDDSRFAQFRLVALDLPGHGDSSFDPRETAYSIAYYKEILCQFAKALDLTGSVFVGHSLGGHIVIETASELEASGMLIVGTPPLPSPMAMVQAFNLANPALAYLSKAHLTPSEAEILAKACVHSGSHVSSQDREDILKTDPRARELLAKSLGGNDFVNEIEILSQSNIPCAVVQGSEDSLINNEWFQQLDIINLWRQGVHFVSNSGHNVHLDAAERFNEILWEFASEITLGKGNFRGVAPQHFGAELS
jgi:pimeloyl-ACP methyl ester carboxylesterase